MILLMAGVFFLQNNITAINFLALIAIVDSGGLRGVDAARDEKRLSAAPSSWTALPGQ